MSIAVIRFFGSNCDMDAVRALRGPVSTPAELVWHTETELPPETTGVLLPGGFSYGDYLRPGAMAKTRPIMAAVKRFAARGGPVLGICNGFQVLCESGLLPGALLPNAHGRFVCQTEPLVAETGGRGFLSGYQPGGKLALPVAHHDGNYFAPPHVLETLEREGHIALTYRQVAADGSAALNGSQRAIAGITGGPAHNILGLMPHPERAVDSTFGSTDGLALLQAFVAFGDGSLDRRLRDEGGVA